jgi:hypothetical protein
MSARVGNLRLLAAGVAVLVASALLAGCSGGQLPSTNSAGSSSATSTPSGGSASSSQASFAADWRRAWSDQVTWTRFAMVGIVDGSPGTAQAVSRLMRTSPDMGTLVAPYYGDTKARYFNSMMTTHLETAVALIRAIKAHNQAGIATNEKAWYANAAEIAAFLARENPNIEGTSANDMLKMQLVLTKQETADRLAKRYSAEVGDFDALQAQARQMSDTTSGAIIKQFPSKFQ